jgi:hypothetical protein
MIPIYKRQRCRKRCCPDNDNGTCPLKMQKRYMDRLLMEKALFTDAVKAEELAAGKEGAV